MWHLRNRVLDALLDIKALERKPAAMELEGKASLIRSISGVVNEVAKP